MVAGAPAPPGIRTGHHIEWAEPTVVSQFCHNARPLRDRLIRDGPCQLYVDTPRAFERGLAASDTVNI